MSIKFAAYLVHECHPLNLRPRKKGEQYWRLKTLLLLGLKTIGKKLNAEVSYFSPFLSIFTICGNPAIAYAVVK